MTQSKEELLSDAAHLREFSQSQVHDIWVKYLCQMAEDWTQTLISGVGDNRSDYYRGILAGLKMAQQVPENVVEWAKRAP